MRTGLQGGRRRAAPGRSPAALALLAGWLVLTGLLTSSAAAEESEAGVAGWGSDHVGQPYPEYVTGDECLFCHRDIGPSWPTNPHQTTIRAATDQVAVGALADVSPATAAETQFLLGAERLVRFLRRSKAYGKLEMLTAAFEPGAGPEPHGQLVRTDAMHWDSERFADRCIGCHTTAVDSTSRTFSATSLDCVTCHGEVVFEHSSNVDLVLLSSTPQDARKVNSICSQCHLRGGESKSSGLPYANTFVPGDNLFRDFRVDFSEDAISKLPAIEQHIYQNARDVVGGDLSVTCASCHQVHGNNSDKHQALNDASICASCHVPDTGNSELIESLTLRDGQPPHNSTCEY